MENNEWEPIGKLAVSDLNGSFLDSLVNLGIKTVSHVNCGCSLLENTKSLDEGLRKSFVRTTNLKVLTRSLGLSTLVLGVVDFDFAKGIGFSSLSLQKNQNSEVTSLINPIMLLKSKLTKTEADTENCLRRA